MDTKDLTMPDITDIVKQFGSMPMIKVKKEQYDRWVNNCMSEKNKTQTSWIYLNGTKRKLHNYGYTLWIQEPSKGDCDIRTFLYYDEEKKEEEKEDENPNKGCDACGDDNNGYGMFLYREGKYSYCAGCMDVGWKKKENKNIEKK